MEKKDLIRISFDQKTFVQKIGWKKCFGPKRFRVKKRFGPNKLIVQIKCGFKICNMIYNLGSKKFGSKIFVSEKCCVQKVFSAKYLSPRKFCVLATFGVKNNCV